MQEAGQFLSQIITGLMTTQSMNEADAKLATDPLNLSDTPCRPPTNLSQQSNYLVADCLAARTGALLTDTSGAADPSTENTAAGYRHNDPNPEDLSMPIFSSWITTAVFLTENHEEPRFMRRSLYAPAASMILPTAQARALPEHLLFKGNRNSNADYEAEKPHLDRIVELYEAHFQEVDPARRVIYAEINTEAQLAAEYAVPNEIDKPYNGMGAVD